MPNGQAQLIANLAEDEFKTYPAAPFGTNMQTFRRCYRRARREICGHRVFRCVPGVFTLVIRETLGIAFLQECKSRDGFARRKQLDLHKQK